LVLVLVVFGVGNLLESYILVPKLVGNRIGLHPVAVIFAVLAFGELFGFIGVLLALPMASIAMVLLRFLRERYEASSLFAGREQPKIISAAGVPVEKAEPPPAENREPPSEP
jgi:predicted PurR-regulated permease PerM